MSAAAKFWDGVAEKYSRSSISNMEAYEEKLRRTRAHFTPDARVLELGCGTGSTAILHAPYVGHIDAADVSGAMLDIGRKRAADAGVDNITFQQTEIDAMSPAPESYDVVMAMSVLHLLEDCRPTFAMAYDALKPGGVLVTSTFVGREDFMWLLWPVLKIGGAIGRIPRVKFFDRKCLRDCQIAAGFQIEDEWKPGARQAVFMIARKPE